MTMSLLKVLVSALLQLSVPVNASFFRGAQRRHGTVASHRAAMHQSTGNNAIPTPAPDLPPIENGPMISVTGALVVTTGDVSGASPENHFNMLNYSIAMPTPQPAMLSGVYCRGAACQYRVQPPPPTFPPMVTPPPLPIGGNLLSGREFCRGLGCIPGMGMPGDPVLTEFNVNCVHLFNDVAGGMPGDDSSRSVAHIHEGFTKACSRRVLPIEAPSCPVYATAFVAANAPKINFPTVGGAVEVCRDTFLWLKAMKQAEIDLRLVPAALPKPKEVSLIASDLNRFGSGGVGPSSARGLKWREYASRHGKWPQSTPAIPQQLDADGSVAGMFIQLTTKSSAPLLPGADAEQATPNGLPKYVQNTLPLDKEQPNVPRSRHKYQIAPPSPDGAMPPVEVKGELWDYCTQQFSEIMLGFTQTARMTAQLTKDWCQWQSSVYTWMGQKEEFGHPDWNGRTCMGMRDLVAFAMRDDLDNASEGFSAQQVCKNVFLGIGALHRADELVKGAWQRTQRSTKAGLDVPAADNPEVQGMLKAAQEYANQVYSRMRNQRAAYQELASAKANAVHYDYANPAVQMPTPGPTPDLPDSEDLPGPSISGYSAGANGSPSLQAPAPAPKGDAADSTSLLALSVERVRQSRRVGIGIAARLKPWGHVE